MVIGPVDTDATPSTAAAEPVTVPAGPVAVIVTVAVPEVWLP